VTGWSVSRVRFRAPHRFGILPVARLVILRWNCKVLPRGSSLCACAIAVYSFGCDSSVLLLAGNLNQDCFHTTSGFEYLAYLLLIAVIQLNLLHHIIVIIPVELKSLQFENKISISIKVHHYRYGKTAIIGFSGAACQTVRHNHVCAFDCALPIINISPCLHQQTQVAN
jgi:hypothetical protein